MILSKDIGSFTKKFEFTDSIITDVKWDLNLFDLLVVVYYYWDKQEGKKESRDLTIRLKNCQEATFSMPKVFESIPKHELKDYVYSWYTITYYEAKEDNGLIEVSIKTIDNDPRWLTAKCEEIWVEGEGY